MTKETGRQPASSKRIQKQIEKTIVDRVAVNILRQQMRVHAEQLTLGTATMIHDLLHSYLKRVDMIIDPISLRGFLEKTLVLSLSLVMVRCAYPSPDGMTYFRHNQPTVSMEP